MINYSFPQYTYGQDIWTQWDKSASSVDRNKIEEAIRNKIEEAIHGHTTKPTSKEKEEERREVERRNTLRAASNVTIYLENSEYRSMILSESEFKVRLKNELLNSSRITDYYKDPYLKAFIDSDPALKKYCDLERKKNDIKKHPGEAIRHITDPQIQEAIKNDPDLALAIAQAAEKKAMDDIKEKQESILRQQEAARKAKEAREAEIKRKKEEKERAKIQAEQNEMERKKDEEVSRQLTSRLVPKHDEGLNHSGDNAVQDDIFEELLYEKLSEEPAITKAKKYSVVYVTPNGWEKAFENASVKAKIELKKKQKELQAKEIAIPIKKADAFMNEIMETAYPGSEMWQKVKVSTAVRHEEEEFISESLKCISKEGLDAVASGDIKKIKKFNECITHAKDAFLDKMGEHIAELTHTKNLRKIYKWFTQKKQNDDEF